jgi:DNA-directed RNA polymerase specialized sigma24 family protein
VSASVAPRLVHLARDRLRAAPRAVADEEDAALNAFDSFVRGASRGRYPRLDDRDDLLRMKGYNNDEIADRLGCSLRTIARKIELIRRTWADDPPAKKLVVETACAFYITVSSVAE